MTSKGTQLVEMRERLLAQVRAHRKLGAAEMLKRVDTELKRRIDSLIKALDDRIIRAIASDDRLSEVAIVLRSIVGTGPAASTMPIALARQETTQAIITAGARRLVTIANALCKIRQKWAQPRLPER